MKKLLYLLIGVVTASAACADETSKVDYGQTGGTASLDLIWEFDYAEYNGQTCAVITGVKNSGGTATVVGDISVPESVIVENAPNTFTGYIVKKIAANAFRNQIGISSVTIPRTVEDIDPPFCIGITSAIQSASPSYKTAAFATCCPPDKSSHIRFAYFISFAKYGN